jgi:hypothetical protein
MNNVINYAERQHMSHINRWYTPDYYCGFVVSPYFLLSIYISITPGQTLLNKTILRIKHKSPN